jgi:DNA-binding MarR family transcriptional regulator
MMEPTTVTALRNMERRGLVRRVRNQGDRRVINVYLTPHGQALKETLLPHALAVNALAATGVEASEIQAMRVALAKLRDNLDADPAIGE